MNNIFSDLDEQLNIYEPIFALIFRATSIYENNEGDIITDKLISNKKYKLKDGSKEYYSLKEMLEDKVNLADIEEVETSRYIRDEWIKSVIGVNELNDFHIEILETFVEICKGLNTDNHYKKKYNKIANALAKLRKTDADDSDEIIKLEDEKYNLNIRFNKTNRGRSDYARERRDRRNKNEK